jgi:DNA-binding transcriptional LysR family regulator
MIDRRLAYVVATARYGSFTAAAAQVGVTQSAITKSVADLERQLGFDIFDRTARGVIVTEEGRLFVDRAVRLLEDANQLLRGSPTTFDPYADVLRIGVCPNSIEWLLMEPLSKLLSRYRQIRFHVSGANADQIVQQLRTGTVDVGFGYNATFSEHPDIRSEPLANIQTCFFARQGHPILELANVGHSALSQYDIVSPSFSRPYEQFINEIYEAHEVDPRLRIHIVDYFPLVSRIIRGSDAIGFVSLSYTRSQAFKKHFAVVRYSEFPPFEALCCAVRRRWTPRPAVRAFIMACRECLPVEGISQDAELAT